jgi:hypothetical protein
VEGSGAGEVEQDDAMDRSWSKREKESKAQLRHRENGCMG